MNIRITITAKPDIAKKILDFCEEEDRTVSSVLRQGALMLIEKELQQKTK